MSAREQLARDETIACGVLLGLFVLVRLLAAQALAFDLVEPEELLNLRLVRQIAEGHAVGDLGAYWYTGVGGNTGAGPWVISALYLPLGLLMEADLGMARVMGTLWSTAGALLVALLGRELLGRGGAAAGLTSALAMPPSWAAWGLMAYGNYVEAAVLTLLAAWLLMRAAGTSARAPAWAAGFGFVAVFSGWFCVSAWPPAGLLAAAAVWLLRANLPALGAAAGGAVVALAPMILGFEPSAEVASPVGGDAVGAVFQSVLGDPLGWPGVVLGSWFGLPLLEWRETMPQDWAAGWQITAAPAALALGLAAVIAALVWSVPPIARRLAMPAASPVMLALAASAVAIPAGLTAIGVGPDSMDVEQLYFYDGRRAALVYPVVGLALAAVGWKLWQLGIGGKIVIAIVLLGSAATTGTMIIAAAAPAETLHPVRYMLCPAEEPVLQSGVCVDALWEDQVAALEALVVREELAAVDARREALMGFGALIREDEESCRPGNVPGGEWGSFGFGAAVATGCEARLDELCGGAPDVDRCRNGAAWARTLD